MINLNTHYLQLLFVEVAKRIVANRLRAHWVSPGIVYMLYCKLITPVTADVSSVISAVKPIYNTKYTFNILGWFGLFVRHNWFADFTQWYGSKNCIISHFLIFYRLKICKKIINNKINLWPHVLNQCVQSKSVLSDVQLFLLFNGRQVRKASHLYRKKLKGTSHIKFKMKMKTHEAPK